MHHFASVIIYLLFSITDIYKNLRSALVQPPVSHLREIQITEEKQSVSQGVSHLTTTKSSSRKIEDIQSKPTKLFEFDDNRNKTNKLDSISRDILVINSSNQPSENNSMFERKLANAIHSDELLTNKKKVYYLKGPDGETAGVPESLKNNRVTSNSSGILAFLSITIAICFFVYVIYLYRCNKPYNCHLQIYNNFIDRKIYIDIAHLQLDKSNIEIINLETPDVDALW